MNKAALKRMTRRTEFYMFVVLVLLCVILTFIGGFIPSRKAARQNPVTLRHLNRR